MASYTITTSNDEDRGLTAAREAYQAALADDHPHKAADFDNAAYVARVMRYAFASYAKQHLNITIEVAD